MTTMTLGVIGAGLMGRELASSVGRWMALTDIAVQPRITAVCDLDDRQRKWFGDHLATIELSTTDYRELLASDVDAVYIAVPHNVHEEIYVATAQAGKALMGEKPFGVDLSATQRIVKSIDHAGVFARCSSEMPFYPGAQQAIHEIQAGRLGTILEARFSFLHSSDLDTNKPINWKRQRATCGPAGVMADLGLHVFHIPLRLGWRLDVLAAHLQDIVPQRPDGLGGTALCDTIDNATIFTNAHDGTTDFPTVFEMKRIAPGHTNSWELAIIGTDGGVKFSTTSPQTLWHFERHNGRQQWAAQQLGSQSTHPSITGSIFEFGFTDAIQQMWASFASEWAGTLGARFGCATPTEALQAQATIHNALEVGVLAQKPVAPPIAS